MAARLTRVLVIPAAGLGTRLQSALPKVLTPVLGRPMLDIILERHAPYCQRVVVVVHPSFRTDVSTHLARASVGGEVVVQMQPTGMLDALLVARQAVTGVNPDRVWVTWCDQVAVSAGTLATLDSKDREARPAGLVVPTVRQTSPYIHFDRDGAGRIVGVRQRREGDEMPPVGESDMGLFSLSTAAFLQQLPEFGLQTTPGYRTGERNFLPFVPWLAVQRGVSTFAVADPIEALGINTADDLAAIERHLRAHPAS